jgi:hypothetical protein
MLQVCVLLTSSRGSKPFFLSGPLNFYHRSLDFGYVLYTARGSKTTIREHEEGCRKRVFSCEAHYERRTVD